MTEYIKPEYLKRWIVSPQSIRYNTTMPGLTGAILERETATEELIAYLQGDEQCQAYSGKSIRVFFTFKSENVTSSTIFALTG